MSITRDLENLTSKKRLKVLVLFTLEQRTQRKDMAFVNVDKRKRMRWCSLPLWLAKFTFHTLYNVRWLKRIIKWQGMRKS